MASYSDMPLATRALMNAFPFSRYRIEDAPEARLSGPLSEAKIALVTTAGLRLEDDEPFDHSLVLGDTSFREIPGDIEVQRLIEDHRSDSFDHSAIERDRNVAFPLDRFRELKEEGVIGSLNKRHFSFMGSIVGPKPLVEESAPEAASKLSEDGVDVAFLTPV